MSIRIICAACVVAGVVTFFTDTAKAVILASDNAADPAYAFEPDGAWKGENPGANENPPGNDNGGSGFLPWDFGGGFHAGGEPYGFLNHFIDGVDFPASAVNDLGAPAFAVANEKLPFSNTTTKATRPFAQELAVGDVFSADFDSPAEYEDYTGFGFPFAIIGFTDATGAETFNIEAGSSDQFGDFNWRYDDSARVNGDFGVDAGGASIAPTDTSDGSSFSLEVLSSTTGRFTFDGLSLDISFIAGVPKSVFFISFDNAESMDGDYNEDGVVGAADYAVWRDLLGQPFTLPNETAGVTPDEVTQEDFDAWKANFGASIGPTGRHALLFDNLQIERPDPVGIGSAAVPEPMSVLLLMAGAGALVAAGTRRAVTQTAEFAKGK